MKTKITIKKVLISISILVGLVAVPIFSSVQAITSSATASATQIQNQQQRIANLKNRADNEINRRVTALNSLISRINLMKHLSAANKSSFVSSIQSEINSINSLKTKIDNDTDLNTLKTDVQSIVTSYRIFALFIPKIHLLSAADRMSDISGKFNDLATKLQTRLTNAQAVGNDVSSLQSALKDMTSKIADANTQYNNVESSVIPLTPDGYPGNKNTLTAARKMIQTGHQDLVTALQDAKTIIQGLKSFKAKTSTSSATP